MRFLSISANNLDEFYTVRVAGLRELAMAGNTTPAADGLSPAEQLVLIDQNARSLMETQQRVLGDLLIELEDQNICVLRAEDLTPADRKYLEEVFLTQVFAVLSPLAIDPAHPFPFIPNTGYALALQLERSSDKRPLQALLPIPAQIDRFIALPASEGHNRFLPLEELLVLNIASLFPGYKLKTYFEFRVLRDSDLEVEEEAEDLVREFEVALKRRRRGEVVRLTHSAGAPEKLMQVIMSELGVDMNEVIEINGMIGVDDLSELVLDSRPDLLWPNFTPRIPERVTDHEGDMLAAIRSKDMLLHHPYETFDMVVRFLQQAARDPQVVAIKQTLYRTSRDSPIVEALCEAAEDGKSVTALGGIEGPFRRGRQHPPIAPAGTGGRACGLRVSGPQDPRQDLHRGAPRGQSVGDLHPLRHRQLPPDHGAYLHRPVTFHLRSTAWPRRHQGLQLPLRLCPARETRQSRDFADHA